MVKKTLKRIMRAPVPGVAILLFAAIISVIICTLQASNDAELKHFDETCQAVEINMTVTSHIGERINMIKPWTYDLLTGKNPVKVIDVSFAKNPGERARIVEKELKDASEVSFAEYVKDVQVKMQQSISTINSKNFNAGASNSFLYGITSLSADKQLMPEYGCEITWYEGYDESIFDGEEAVCIIPAGMAKPKFYDNGNGETDLYFLHKETSRIPGLPVTETARYEYQCTLKIVGTYTSGDGKSIYCPIPIIERVYSELNADLKIDSLSATLADNRRLEEFREKMGQFFVAPSPDAEPIPCGYYVNNRSSGQYYLYYTNALDIDDEDYQSLVAILEDSLNFNRTVTMIVVALSAVAGFLVGFLMIRRRKRDILLMRMVGESNMRVYFGFVFEQMISILLGIAIGGTYNMWKPMDKLALFALLYFVGLTLSLVVFMNTKLIKNLKEDE